jgi:hypothetical protein
MKRPLRTASSIAFCCLLTVASTVAHGQAAAPAKPAPGTVIPPAQVYGKLLSLLEKEYVGAAEAMPEEKYGFAPTTALGEFKGVRTFGEQIKHVAGSNWYFFGGPNMTEAEDKAKEDAVDKLTSKADIVQALKDSFAQAHEFVDGITPDNAFVVMPRGNTRAGMASFGIAHFMDHYGQMAEYMRMNGIVPPASRGGM